MSDIASRTTAYVLLSAVERDLRDLIETYVSDALSGDYIPDYVRRHAIGRRLKAGLSSEITSIGQLLPFLDFKDSFDISMRAKKLLPLDTARKLQSLGPAFDKAAESRNRVAHSRPLDIEDLPIATDLAKSLSAIEGFSWDNSRSALAQLAANPTYVLTSNLELLADPITSVANNLPAPDYDETTLLGRRSERSNVLNALRGAWPVTSIVGDGGIGKTALALQVCYDLIDAKDCQFGAVVWVSAKNAQLTSNEIVRIETEVEDSLGLFASAVSLLGAKPRPADAVDELLAMLASFPTLLVLDNAETVLDDNFPRLLREIPTGSKVLITSRVGVKTESNLHLSGLSTEDAAKLIRILARRRGIERLNSASQSEIEEWVSRMGNHPAFIKWFVAGVQAGRLPEQLLNDDGLVLDFCMSHVFDRIGDDARTILRAMLVVQGSHTLAELAFLTDFDAARLQRAVLDLTNTNFISQVRGATSGTAFELSDFARTYLRRTLRIDTDEHRQLVAKQKSLYDVGGRLRSEHANDPYSAETIDVRGVGDYNAARFLRSALDRNRFGDVDGALALCLEAASLAPGYHEVARIEGYIHEKATNFAEAYESYARAADMAPSNPHVAYYLGAFLVSSGFNPDQGLSELRRAASLDPESSFLHLAISEAYVECGLVSDGIDAAIYAIKASAELTEARRRAVFQMFATCSVALNESAKRSAWVEAAETLERVVEEARNIDPRDFYEATLDICMSLSDVANSGAKTFPEDYVASALARAHRQLTEIRRRADPSHLERRIGDVVELVDRGFGFIRSGSTQYFFHASALWDPHQFDKLWVGAKMAFTPGPAQKGTKPRAESAYRVG